MSAAGGQPSHPITADAPLPETCPSCGIGRESWVHAHVDFRAAYECPDSWHHRVDLEVGARSAGFANAAELAESSRTLAGEHSRNAAERATDASGHLGEAKAQLDDGEIPGTLTLTGLALVEAVLSLGHRLAAIEDRLAKRDRWGP